MAISSRLLRSARNDKVKNAPKGHFLTISNNKLIPFHRKGACKAGGEGLRIHPLSSLIIETMRIRGNNTSCIVKLFFQYNILMWC